MDSSEPLAPGDLIGLSGPAGPRLAVVASLQGSRVEVRCGGDGRPRVVPRRELARLAQLPIDWPRERLPGSPDQPPWTLSPTALAAAAPRPRELAAAWLLLRELGDQGGVDLAGLVDLVGDGGDPAQRAACWLWLEGAQTLFRRRQQRLEPRPLAELRQLRHARRRSQLDEQRRLQWRQTLQRRQPLEASRLEPSQQEDLRLLRRWAGGDSSDPLPEPLTRLLHECHCPLEAGAIRHLLVDLGQWERHHLNALEASSWQEGFGGELLAEADRLVATADIARPGDELRRDLSGQRVITIDDDDTLEIDDGLSLERLDAGRERLWIHIADPGRLVEAGSPLDREAARRASSLYLAGGTLPMFPPQLAHGPMSLRSGQRCAAWSLWVELDSDGAVLADGLTRSWIRPAYRLSYEDVDALLELAPPQERDLLAIAELLSRRQDWRRRQGALQLEDPEGRIRVRRRPPPAGEETDLPVAAALHAATRAGGGGEPEPPQPPTGQGERPADDLQAELEVIETTPARRLVAEAMILAGSLVAERGRLQGLALPYRSQAICELPSATELAQLAPGPVRHAAIKRCLSKGLMGTTPSPHFSLGLVAYVQATSPIRRYCDLLVQRQLGCLLACRTPLSESQLSDILRTLEAPLRQGVQIQREDQRHWLQVWFEQQPRRPWQGLFLRWLRADQQLALVWLEEICQSLPCHCPPRSEPGCRLLVRVREVDSLQDRLRLEASA